MIVHTYSLVSKGLALFQIRVGPPSTQKPSNDEYWQQFQGSWSIHKIGQNLEVDIACRKWPEFVWPDRQTMSELGWTERGRDVPKKHENLKGGSSQKKTKSWNAESAQFVNDSYRTTKIAWFYCRLKSLYEIFRRTNFWLDFSL